MSDDSVVVERRGAAFWITINRPAKRNALNGEVIAAITRGFHDAQNDPETRVIVLTGAGDKAFCAGADLKERAGMSEEEVRAFLLDLRRTFRALELSDKIFVAAINGAAYGGGTELALACDLRVIRRGAKMALTETRLAIIPGGGGTQRLPRLVGMAVAKDLILTGRAVDAEEAYRLGLVNRIAADDDVVGAAVALAAEVAEGGPIALAAAKAAIQQGMELGLDEALELEYQQYQRTLHTADRLEGLAAFREKRKPVYRGV